jgi:hypothetical protein
MPYGPPYAENYEGVIQALIDKFGLVAVPMFGPPYDHSFRGIIQAIQDLNSGGGGSGGSGTVTSINLTAPGGLFDVAGVPITIAGTIVLTLDLQPANTFFAGPAAGALDTPVFRALVPLDIPDLDASIITTGLINPVVLGLGVANATTFLRGDGQWAVPPSSGGSGGLTWQTTAANESGIAGNGYIATGISRVFILLPAAPAIGDEIAVYAGTSAGWQIAQNPGQSIRFQNLSSVVGVTGYLRSNGFGDAAWLVYLGNDVWGVINHEGTLAVGTAPGMGFPIYYTLGIRGFTG